MARVALRRLIELVAVLWLVSLGTFFLLSLVPGDPAVAILGPNRTAADYERVREDLGLNEPVLDRYLDWIGDAVQGDLGEALVPPRVDVSDRVVAALPVSLQLAAMGIVIALALSVPLALWSAANPNGRVDRSVTALSFGLASLPAFLAGLLLILVFVKTWQVFPRVGWVRITSDEGVATNLHHALLPALAVALPDVPVFVRVLRSDLIGTLQQDYIAAARARGMAPRRILLHDALRPSSFSLVTLAGVSLGRLIGSTVIVEALFGLPGLGSLIVDAAVNRDIPLLQGAVLAVAVIYVLVNTAVDISYTWLDPRLRRKATT